MTEKEQIEAEIDRCNLILGVTDGLGAEHSDLGLSTKFTDRQIERAERKLPMLRLRLAQINGERTDNPYIRRGIVI